MLEGRWFHKHILVNLVFQKVLACIITNFFYFASVSSQENVQDRPFDWSGIVFEVHAPLAVGGVTRVTTHTDVLHAIQLLDSSSYCATFCAGLQQRTTMVHGALPDRARWCAGRIGCQKNHQLHWPPVAWPAFHILCLSVCWVCVRSC